MTATRRIMLHSGGMTERSLEAVRAHVGSEAVFVPFAGFDHDQHTERMRERLAPVSIRLHAIHRFSNPLDAIRGADAIVVGGGNSFRLLKRMQELGLLPAIREAVDRGVPYFGSSAGSNVACPTIRTTNDMPIVVPESLDALGLIPFQINPHYIDPPPPEQRIGETREQRLTEFLQENDALVLGLREESWVTVEGPRMALDGPGGAILFRRNRDPEALVPGNLLSELLLSVPRYDAPLA